MPLSSLYKGKGLILRLSGVMVLLSLLLSFALVPQPASAVTNIAQRIDPSPSNYVLNDGTGTEYMWWQVTYESTPVTIVHYITEPDNVTKFHIETWDISALPHPGTTYNPHYNTGHPWFSNNPTDAEVWNVPAGTPPGAYKSHVEYYSTDSAVYPEKEDIATFYVGAPPIPSPAPAGDPPGMTVGGIAEFPVDGSNSSSPPYAVIIGGAIAALAAIAFGGWFARRRWLQRYS